MEEIPKMTGCHPMTADELELEFAPHALRAFTQPGILMLDADHALRLIARARTAALPVLGIDGFLLEGAKTIPLPEHLADFSQPGTGSEGAWDVAARFIEERRKLGLAFEVVLGERAMKPEHDRRR